MYVLDLDLDFFLDNICPLAEKGTRPDANQASPWPEEQVRFFLEHNCGLRPGNPGAPGPCSKPTTRPSPIGKG